MNNKNIVNTNSNLLFTAQFGETTNNVYKTNRNITCSAYLNQADFNNEQAIQLFINLEQAFGSAVVLSYYPFVALEPAFTRGKIIHTSDELFFNGLSSNASGDGSQIL